MIKKVLTSEIFFAAAVVAFVAVLVSTRSVDMSGMVQSAMLGVFGAAVLGLASVTYKENPADEREHDISMRASKHAYIIGAITLSIGIIVQSIDHNLEPWLPISLGAMVVVKSLSYFYQNK